MGKVDLQFSDYYGSRYGGASGEIISHDKEAGLAYGVFPRCICTRSRLKKKLVKNLRFLQKKNQGPFFHKLSIFSLKKKILFMVQ